MRYNKTMERWKAFGELCVEIAQRIKDETQIKHCDVAYRKKIPSFVYLHNYPEFLMEFLNAFLNITSFWRFDYECRAFLSKIRITIYGHGSERKESWFSIDVKIQSRKPERYYFPIKRVLYEFKEKIDDFSLMWNKDVKVKIYIPDLGGEELRDGVEWNQIQEQAFYLFIENIRNKHVSRERLIEFMKMQLDWWDSLVA